MLCVTAPLARRKRTREITWVFKLRNKFVHQHFTSKYSAVMAWFYTKGVASVCLLLETNKQRIHRTPVMHMGSIIVLGCTAIYALSQVNTMHQTVS